MADIAEEYRTILEGAGWFDWSHRGRIELDGPDALSFLQALVSNDVAGLRPHQGLYATYLTPQGRMVTDLEVYHRGDVLIADVPAGMGPTIARKFDEVIFTENVTVRDLSSDTSEIAIVGARAASAVAITIGADADALEALPELGQLSGRRGFAVRSGEALLPIYKVIMSRAEREAATGPIEEMPAVSAALMEFLRIEAARPAFGLDMTEDTIPLEAGLLERAISTSKGCYVGQEVVIRILHRGGGRVVKRLVKFECADIDATPAREDPVVVDGRDVGRVTSVARSPLTGTVIALAFVHRDFADVGRALRVGAGAAEARIVAFAS